MRDGRLKILMVITTLDTGGAEKHLHLLSRELARRGHRIEVVYLKGSGSLAPDFEAACVAVDKVPFEGPGRLPGAVVHLAARIRRGGYHIVHSHLLKADLVSALAGMLAGPVPLVASKHNDERALLNPLVSFAHGVISARADRVIALSDHVARFVARHGRVAREKIRRIYYGLDPEAFRPQPDGPERVRRELSLVEGVPVLTMVARFAPQKDHATLLEAVRRLKQEGIRCRLLLVGDDPFGDGRRRMERLCDALDLGKEVTFTGVRQDVPDLLAVTDVFVMPSLWEGLGLVFLEAMAHALPVVSNRVSAVPEIVVHGNTGTLVHPRDPEALKEALADLLANGEKAARFGRHGRERLASLFTLDRMVKETEAVYLQALEHRP